MMDCRYALPRPVRVLEDESLASLVTRNAAAYRFANPMLVLQPLELGKIELGRVSRLPPTTALARLLGVDLGTLRVLSSWNAMSGMASVGGHEIRPMFLDGYVRRSCPHCLRDSLHHRAFWDVMAIDVCPRHGTALTGCCPGCGKAPQWMGCRLDRCGNGECSFDLTCTNPGSQNPMPVADHVRGLHALYAAGPDAKLPGTGLVFGRAVEAAFGIGCHSGPAGRSGRSDSFLRRHADRVQEVMERGWQVLSRWPNRFYEVLDELRLRASTREEIGLRREFGGLSTWLSRCTTEAWSEPLREVFAAYLARQPDMGVSVMAVRRYRCAQYSPSDHMTTRAAATFLGLSMETTRVLAARQDLYAVRGATVGSGVLLRADLVHALKARKEASLLQGEAAAMLGIRVPMLAKLLERGLLASIPRAKRITQHRLVLRSEVEALLERVYRSLEPMVSRRTLVPLAFVMAGQRDTVDVLQAVLDGRLCARGTASGERNLRQLLFDGQEVREAIPLGDRAAGKVRKSASRPRGLHLWNEEGYLSAMDAAGSGSGTGSCVQAGATLVVPDALWTMIAPLLPSRQPRGGRPRASDRVILAGVLFVLRTGSQWREMPPDLGCGGLTCWRRLREWQADGVWPRLQRALMEGLPDAATMAWPRVMEGASLAALKRGDQIRTRKS